VRTAAAWPSDLVASGGRDAASGQRTIASRVVAAAVVGASHAADDDGKANEHNGAVPRDHWLTAAERKAIIDFHHQHPLEGYRRLTYMMIDRNIVACSLDRPDLPWPRRAMNGLPGFRR
jgi:hypothetical protein